MTKMWKNFVLGGLLFQWEIKSFALSCSNTIPLAQTAAIQPKAAFLSPYLPYTTYKPKECKIWCLLYLRGQKRN